VTAPGYSSAMGLLDKVKGYFSRAAAPAPGPLTAKNFEGGLLASGTGGRGPPKRGTLELIQMYNLSPWLRAVTSRIARAVAGTQWRIYARAELPARSRTIDLHRESRDGLPPVWRWGQDRMVRDHRLQSGSWKVRAAHRRSLQRAGVLREVVDHPLLKLLAKPNEFMSGEVALKVTQIWLDIKGEAFWLVAFDAEGQPSSVYPVPPHWVTQVPNNTSPYFLVTYGGLQMKVDPKAVLWFRDVDPASPYGRGSGIAESLGDELETDEFAAKYIKTWFFNSATPSIMVGLEEAGGKGVEEARAKWEAAHRGVHNAHRAHFASGKINAVKLDTAFREQQLVELRRMERDTCVQVFGVPPEVIGIIEDSNRATIDSAFYMFVVGVEHPRVQFLRAEIASQLLTKYPGGDAAVLEAEMNEPEDKSHRLEVMKAQPRAFELNEWRAEAGFEPKPELSGKYPDALPGQAPAQLEPGDKPSKLDDEEDADLVIDVEPERADPPWAKSLS
jgi:HK97 family phage portal protein